MYGKLVVLLTCLFCLMFSVAGATDYKTYENTTYHFKVNVPVDYEYLNSTNPQIALNAGNSKTMGVMNVSVAQPADLPTTLTDEAIDDLLFNIEESLKARGADNIVSGVVTVSGQKTIYFNYNVTLKYPTMELHLRMEQFSIPYRGKMYTLTYSYPEDKASDFHHISTESVTTFTFTN